MPIRFSIAFFLFTCRVAGVYAQKITYYEHIKPILTSYCMPCHAKGNIGSMPLNTYEAVTDYAKMIQFVTSSKLMPPWKADERYSAIKGAGKLKSEEIKLVEQWIKGGMVKGARKTDTPFVQKHLIKYDYSFGMKQHFVHTGGYTEENRVFVIPVNNAEDIYIDALEFVPGNKKIVSSCAVSIDTSTMSQTIDGYDNDYGYSSFGGVGFLPNQFVWYQWTPEQGVKYFDSGYVKKIPAGSRLLFHVNYMPIDIAQTDSSYLKIRLANDGSRKKIIKSLALITKEYLKALPLIINRDQKRKFYASVILDRNIELYSIMPQGQFACQSWEIFAIDKESGRQINLLHIPEWDFHWRKKYDLQKPIYLPAGTEIQAIATYNNTEENPSLSILPPVKIKYGESKSDEMFLVLFDLVYL